MVFAALFACGDSAEWVWLSLFYNENVENPTAISNADLNH